MREELRTAARILVVDGTDRVLLFRFAPGGRDPFWATAGGGVEGEATYVQAFIGR